MIEKYHELAKERKSIVVLSAGNVCAPDEILCNSLVTKLGPLKEYRSLQGEKVWCIGKAFRQFIGLSPRLEELWWLIAARLLLQYEVPPSMLR